MNKGTIARIIIWGLVALLLIGVLVFLFAADDVIWHRKTDETRGSFRSDNTDYDADRSTDGDAPRAVTRLDGVREIEIEWMSGEVKIVPTDGELRFYEDYSGEEKYQMVYRVDGGTLKIDICEEQYWPFFSLQLPEKTLTVELPRQSITKLSIGTVSADVDVRGAQIQELDIDTVSGGIVLKECDVTELETATVSGKIEGGSLTADEVDANSVSGSIELSILACRSIDAETTSGKIDVACASGLETIDLNTTSGKMNLTLPYDCAASVKWDTVSGSLNDNTRGTRTVQVEAESVSGGLTIENAPEA